MNTRTKTLLIQLAGLLLCLVCACVGIFWHMARIGDTPTAQDDPSDPVANDLTADQGGSYDPLLYIENVAAPEKTPQKSYDYYESAKNYNMLKPLLKDGYKLSYTSYNKEEHKLGAVPSNIKFPADVSQTKRKVQRPGEAVRDDYGYHTGTQTVTEDCPVLVPYYGYVIYTASGVCKLLDSNLNVLMNSFNGYLPAYTTDYCGNPLFIKDGRYYFYYDGKNYGGTVYTKVDNDTLSKLPKTAPDSYKYFNYDVDMLNNLFVTNDFDNEANMGGIVYSLPDRAGMAEFTVNEDQLSDLMLPSESFNRGNGKLFRFPAYTYTKKEEKKIDDKPYYSYKVTDIRWGYMDANGKVVIEPKYKNAFEFSSEGLAVVESDYGRIYVINERGSVIFNIFETAYDFNRTGNFNIRDGHYLPDTYGIESTGMLYFDQGYLRVRRKIIDTDDGYRVRWESSALVDTKGQTVNIPYGCTLEGYADGIMLIKYGERYGYMRTDGSWLVEPELKYAKPFSEGVAVMGYTKDTLGLIDTEGNYLLYPMYSHIESCSGGVVTAYSQVGGWSVFNKVSKTKIKEVTNPIIALKERAIAEGRDNYYNKEEEVNKDELSGGQS